MKNQATIITTTLVMALALVVGACGDTNGSGGSSASSGGSASATAANITFRTDPRGVEVWIDGKNAGTTPVVIAVEPGTRAVEFRRDGFEPVKDSIDVEAGKDLTVTSALAVTGSPEERVSRLLAALEIPEHENLEPKAHRGSTPPVMLYWPQRDVRKAGVGTWRIEVGDYDDDGFLVFKKGKKVLHREPFTATSIVMEGALPPSVMEALNRGTTITWGIDFENKRKKDVLAKFKVKDGRALERKLKKLEKRSVYKRAGDLERQVARIELKRNYRFYTEALTDAMSVLNTWPDTEIADKVIADSLQRLKLKDTLLYTEIMKRLRGAGRTTGSGGLGNVGRGRGLAPSLVAPKIRPSSGSAAAPRSGLSAGGIGVTPTGGAHKRKPGPIAEPGSGAEGGSTGSSGGSGQPAQPGGRTPGEGRADRPALSEQLADLEKQREELEAAEQKRDDAQRALEAAGKAQEDAQQAVNDAQKALENAQAGGDATAIQNARDALSQAEEGLAEADKAQEEATEAHRAAEQEAEAVQDKHGGSADDVRKREGEVRRQLDGPGNPGSQQGHRGSGRAGQRPLGEIQSELERVEQLQEQLDAADQKLADAEQAIEASRQAMDDAVKALSDAEEALDQAKQAGDDDAIKAADEAVHAARQAIEDTEKAHESTRAAHDETVQEHRKIHEEQGSTEEVRQQRRRLRAELDERSGVGNDPLAGGNSPQVDGPSGNDPAAPGTGGQGHVPGSPAADQMRLRRAADEAQKRLTSANQHLTATRTALDAAQTRYDDALKALDAAETSGDNDAIAEAEAALLETGEDLARSQMDAERAEAEVNKASQDLKDAQDEMKNRPAADAGKAGSGTGRGGTR